MVAPQHILGRQSRLREQRAVHLRLRRVPVVTQAPHDVVHSPLVNGGVRGGVETRKRALRDHRCRCGFLASGFQRHRTPCDGISLGSGKSLWPPTHGPTTLPWEPFKIVIDLGIEQPNGSRGRVPAADLPHLLRHPRIQAVLLPWPMLEVYLAQRPHLRLGPRRQAPAPGGCPQRRKALLVALLRRRHRQTTVVDKCDCPMPGGKLAKAPL